MEISITFSECEHDGDLENYKEDLRTSGAIVKRSRVNEEEETGEIIVEVEDRVAFFDKFKETEGYEFSNIFILNDLGL